MSTTEKPQWVVYDGQIYRADHKSAPFTDTEGKHYPDFHDGLVALVYGKQHLPLIAAAPELLEACKKARTCASVPDEVVSLLRAAIAKAEGRA